MYITVKQAVELTNKSQSTINNYCNKFKNTDKIKIVSNKYLINRIDLLQFYSIPEPDILTDNNNTNNVNNTTNNDTNFIEFLQTELSEKNKQITELQKLLHESNVNINQLTNQLKLSTGTGTNTSGTNNDFSRVKAFFYSIGLITKDSL